MDDKIPTVSCVLAVGRNILCQLQEGEGSPTGMSPILKLTLFYMVKIHRNNCL